MNETTIVEKRRKLRTFSGGGVKRATSYKHMYEATHDDNGLSILDSSHEHSHTVADATPLR